MNTCNFILLAILNRGGGGVGTDEDGGDGGEAGSSVGGGGIRGIPYLIIWIALHGETFTSSSSSLHEGEIKGLFFGPLFPSFL